MKKVKERDYANLSWEELTPEEQTRFKIRYAVLKVTEVVTVLAVITGLYFWLR